MLPILADYVLVNVFCNRRTEQMNTRDTRGRCNINIQAPLHTTEQNPAAERVAPVVCLPAVDSIRGSDAEFTQGKPPMRGAHAGQEPILGTVALRSSAHRAACLRHSAEGPGNIKKDDPCDLSTNNALV